MIRHKTLTSLPSCPTKWDHLKKPDLCIQVLSRYVRFLQSFREQGMTVSLLRRIETQRSCFRAATGIERKHTMMGRPSLNGNRVESAEQAEALVREYHEAGFDLLKVHEGLTPEEYDAIAATANELGIPFAGHVTDHVGLFKALEAGQTTIDHLDNFIQALVPEEDRPDAPPGLRGVDAILDRVDETRFETVIQATLDADASVVPTMVLWESGLFPIEPSEVLLEQRRRQLRRRQRNSSNRFAMLRVVSTMTYRPMRVTRRRYAI